MKEKKKLRKIKYRFKINKLFYMLFQTYLTYFFSFLYED